MQADAEAAGRAALEAASTRAENELKELRRKADEQISQKTAAMESEIAAEAERLRQSAERKLSDAAAIVVERIVGV